MIAEFGSLLAVVFLVLLVIGWRSGWFIEAEPSREQRAKAKRSTRASAEGAKRRNAIRAPLKSVSDGVRGAVGLRGPGSEAPRRNGTTIETGRPAAAPKDDGELEVHPAVAAASRRAGIEAAERSLRDHWAADTIKKRPGWLMFELADFLGPASTVMSYKIPGLRTPGYIDMFAIEDVRALERGDGVIAESRRRIVQQRWSERQARAANGLGAGQPVSDDTARSSHRSRGASHASR